MAASQGPELGLRERRLTINNKRGGQSGSVDFITSQPIHKPEPPGAGDHRPHHFNYWFWWVKYENPTPLLNHQRLPCKISRQMCKLMGNRQKVFWGSFLYQIIIMNMLILPVTMLHGQWTWNTNTKLVKTFLHTSLFSIFDQKKL